MKIRLKEGHALQPLADKLEDLRVGMLTLREPQNGLCGRPMTAIEMDEQGAIWFMASRKSTAPLLGSAPQQANLSFSAGSDSNFVSIAGMASMSDDADRKKALWSLAARPWFDGVDDPDLTLIRVSPGHVEIWDGPDNAVSRVLSMAASVVAGKEIGMGHKETVDVPTTR